MFIGLTVYLTVLLHVLPSQAVFPPVETDYTKDENMYHQASFMGRQYMGKVPLLIQRRKGMKGEYPMAALVVMVPGPDLTGAIISTLWVLVAGYPGFVRRPRPAALNTKLGRIYAGFAWGEDMSVEGKKGEDMSCPNTGDKNVQCRNIVEIVMQNSIKDPGALLMLLRANSKFHLQHNVDLGAIVSQTELPPYHREQCMALWFMGNPLHDTGEKLPIIARKTRQGKRLYDLWIKPLGLWSVKHCHHFTEKMHFACGDDRKDEEIFYGKNNSDLAFWEENEDEYLLSGAGGPTNCPSRGPSSAVVVCQNFLAAIKVPVRSAFDVLINDGNFAPNEVRCNYEAKALRGLYVWVGAQKEWINSVTLKDCAGRGSVPQVQSFKYRPDLGHSDVKLTPVIRESKGSTAKGHAAVASALAAALAARR